MTSLRESAIRRALAGDPLVGREVRVLPEVGSTKMAPTALDPFRQVRRR